MQLILRRGAAWLAFAALIVSVVVVADPPADANAGATAARFHTGYFQSPSGNIHCDFVYPGKFTYVRCGLKSGFRPSVPTRGPGCDPPRWVTLTRTGSPALQRSICPGEDAGDAGPFIGGQRPGPPAAVLRYGMTWGGGGLRCNSAVSGLTCRSSVSGHGFFLSRARWRVF
jgi:hypothetical protein